MKKTPALALALTMILACATAAFAGDKPGTLFTLEVEPTFTVTIPDTIALSADGTEVPVSVSDVKYLGSQRISVQFGGTNYTANQLALIENGDMSVGGYKLVLYVLKDTAGNTLVDPRDNGNSGDSLIGTELLSFRGDGTAHYRVDIRNGWNDPVPQPGIAYAGTLTYNIALV